MEASDLIQKTGHGAVAEIDREELSTILEKFEVIRAVDTGVAGWIRVLSVGGQPIVQEETPDGEILLRGFESAETADAFVNGRLADYDRMWDGCGCKIDYFGPARAG